MNDHEKSHVVVVPAKRGNKGAEAKAEATADQVEGRTATKRNSTEGDTYRTQGRESVTSALGRVREAARRNRTMKFTALLHHVTVGLLRDSYYALKREAAPGVDGGWWQEYEPESIEGRIERSLPREPTSRKRMDGNAPWASQPWRTRSFSRP